MTMSHLPGETGQPGPSMRKQHWASRLAKGGLKSLAWTVTVLLTTVLLALACTQMIQWLFGDVAGYQRWTADHAGFLQAWRMGIYAALAAGWWPIRRRLGRLPGGPSRLVRCESLAVLVIALYELHLHL